MSGLEVYSTITCESFEASDFKLCISDFVDDGASGGRFLFTLEGYDLCLGFWRAIDCFYDIDDAWTVYSDFRARLHFTPDPDEFSEAVVFFWPEPEAEPEESLENLPFAPEPEAEPKKSLEDISSALDDAFSLKQSIEDRISEDSPYRFFSTGSRKESIL